MQQVVAFVCDFCPRKKRFAAKATAERHEGRCFHNPIRRACATCSHFSNEKPYTDRESGYTESGGPFCEVDALNYDPESSTVLRADCEQWKAKGN